MAEREIYIELQAWDLFGFLKQRGHKTTLLEALELAIAHEQDMVEALEAGKDQPPIIIEVEKKSKV